MTNSREMDFPAAHSMDTTWFGVDEDGEIAAFRTGENGPVPKQARDGKENFPETIYDTCPIDDKGITHIPADGDHLAALCDKSFLPKPRITNITRKRQSNPNTGSIAILFSDKAHLIRPSTYRPAYLFRYHQPLVYYHGISHDELTQAIKENKILSCTFGDGKTGLENGASAQGITEEEFKTNLSNINEYYEHRYQKETFYWFYKYFGIHVYEARYGPKYFEAEYRPANPIKYDNLPKSDKTPIIKIPNIKFSETAAIQPLALFECSTWQGQSTQWFSLDGLFHIGQKFEHEMLIDKTGEPFSDDQLSQMSFRPIGTTPKPLQEPEPPTPPVPIGETISYTHIICLEDGMKVVDLENYLKSVHNMDPHDYKEKWGLSYEYPMMAPKYQNKKSGP